ncbi:MAG: DUF3987 domain-containing protein [Phycisphaerales bacterium]|nr:DUF3987 domain-containing protein [Phycisphaerales bacterium]
MTRTSDIANAMLLASAENDPPLTPAIAWQPFPAEALPEPMQTFVHAVADATGTDPAFSALAALTTAAGCIGNRAAGLVHSSWVEPAIVWAALVGRSGTTKSPVLKICTRPLVEIFKANRKTYADEIERHEVETERYAVQLATWKSKQKNETTDPPVRPPEPREKRVLVSDVTIEKLAALLNDNPLGLLVVRDELAGWVKSFDQYRGGKGADAEGWLSFYDAAPHSVDRKGGGSTFVERGAVSICGTIQPGTLRRVFGAAEREAGLLARVLLCWPPEKPSLYRDAGVPDAVMAAWKTLLQTLLNLPPGVDEDGDPRPRCLPIDEWAKMAWVSWHDAHERMIADESDDDIRAHMAKLQGMSVRLALIFECITVAAGGQAARSIGRDSIDRAIKIVDWFARETRRVYGLLNEGDEEREQRHLASWIEARGGSVTARDLARGLRRFGGDAEAAREALEQLEAAGFGRFKYAPIGPAGGRPAERFQLEAAQGADET